MRLIDADKLLADNGLGHECNDCEQNTYECGNYRRYTLMSFCEMVDNAPTADAVSAKHGHWNVKYAPSKDELTLIECSECGARQFVMNPKKERYCFNCGVKMDGDEDES